MMERRWHGAGLLRLLVLLVVMCSETGAAKDNTRGLGRVLSDSKGFVNSRDWGFQDVTTYDYNYYGYGKKKSGKKQKGYYGGKGGKKGYYGGKKGYYGGKGSKKGYYYGGKGTNYGGKGSGEGNYYACDCGGNQGGTGKGKGDDHYNCHCPQYPTYAPGEEVPTYPTPTNDNVVQPTYPTAVPSSPTSPYAPTSDLTPTYPTVPTAPSPPSQLTPTGPVPTYPTVPTVPFEPTYPSEPSSNLTPSEPTVPSAPFPLEPSSPSAPSEPTSPSAPSEATSPSVPSEPSSNLRPSEPTVPSAPSALLEPTSPSAPSDPTSPSAPSDPTSPSAPSDPTSPSAPSAQATEDPTSNIAPVAPMASPTKMPTRAPSVPPTTVTPTTSPTETPVAPPTATPSTSAPTAAPSTTSAPLTEQENYCQNYYDGGGVPANSDTAILDAKINLEVEEDTTDEQLDRIYDSINNIMWRYVGPSLLGCEVRGGYRRRLQDSTITGANFGPTGEAADATCTASDSANKCVPTSTPAEVAYQGDGSDLQAQLDRVIDDAIALGLFDVTGVVGVSNGSTGGDDGSGGSGGTGGDGDGDGTNGQDTDPSAINREFQRENNGALVAVPVVVGVSLVLLALLFATRRHRREDQNTSFVKYVDESGDLSDDESTRESSEGPRVRVVEDDWTGSSGYSPRDESIVEDSTLGGLHSTMDVHICQSSLCQVCEHRKTHGGVKFIKASDLPPSPSRLPTDASRDYSADDTVDL